MAQWAVLFLLVALNLSILAVPRRGLPIEVRPLQDASLEALLQVTNRGRDRTFYVGTEVLHAEALGGEESTAAGGFMRLASLRPTWIGRDSSSAHLRRDQTAGLQLARLQQVRSDAPFYSMTWWVTLTDSARNVPQFCELPDRDGQRILITVRVTIAGEDRAGRVPVALREGKSYVADFVIVAEGGGALTVERAAPAPRWWRRKATVA